MSNVQAFAAEYLGVSRRTVQRWLEDGKLQSLALPALERCKAEYVDLPAGMISADEAAGILGISRESVTALTYSAGLPSAVRLGRKCVDRQAVLDYDATRGFRKKNGCRRCTILLPLDEGGHCWLCAFELEHGRHYFYPLDGSRRANSLRASVNWKGWAGR